MKPLLIGHRGYGANRTEKELSDNSLPSFRKAVDEKVDGCETDVQLTKDGHFILYHDFELRGGERRRG